MLLYIIPAKAGIQSFAIFPDSHLRVNGTEGQNVNLFNTLVRKILLVESTDLV